MMITEIKVDGNTVHVNATGRGRVRIARTFQSQDKEVQEVLRDFKKVLEHALIADVTSD